MSADSTFSTAIPAAQAELARRIARFAPDDGVHDTAVPALKLIRSSTATACTPSVYEPRLCIVAQGSKIALLGGETYHYDPLNYLVVSVTLPMVGQVIQASPEEPYLCLRLDVDPDMLGGLILDTGPSPATAIDRGLYAARAHPQLLDAVLRLMRLLDSPADLPVLAPLALREIFYRVLVGELGHRLRDLATADNRSHRIARAVHLLRQRYLLPISIDALAGEVHMSTSSLHRQFKAVTAMSPLQFQKQLRLHEARRLMLVEGIEATSAAHRVGYESASQFNREYKRLFGAPPRSEVERIRAIAG